MAETVARTAGPGGKRAALPAQAACRSGTATKPGHAALVAQLGRLIRSCPEWWTVLLSVLAWLALALTTRSAGVPWLLGICLGAAGGVAHATSVTAAWYASASPGAAQMLHWNLMIGAMMFPLLLAQVRHVAYRSFSFRIHRGIAMFLAGYLLPWCMFGMAALSAIGLARVVMPSADRLLPAAGFMVAAAWQLTPVKRRALARCHRSAGLAASGWRADVACAAYGGRLAGACMASCWAMMFASAAATPHLGAMLPVLAITAAERYGRRPPTRWSALLLMVLACAIGKD